MRRLLLISLLTVFSLAAASQTVYITKTGKKYHQQDCRYLSSSSISISLTDAINRSYGACSVCAPTQSPNAPTKQPSHPNSPKQNPKSPNKSNICTAITKLGNQCTRVARTNSLCWQHGG